MAFTLWRPGMRITASRLNASTPGLWQSWEPIFSTTTGSDQSTFGTDSDLRCTYTVAGNTCWFVFKVEFGSTATFNTAGGAGNNWTFSLPVTAAQSSIPLGGASIMTGDGDGSFGLAYAHTTNTMLVYTQAQSPNDSVTSAGIVDSSAPHPWAAGDRLEITGHYQIA